MAVAAKKYRFTADQFVQMDKAEVLDREFRFELIDGEIIVMPPINPPHASLVNRLTELFVVRLQGRAIVQVQSPIRLDSRSVPQPDIALLAPQADYYSKYLPDPQTVLLAIEVADSSLRYDLDVKAPLYAEAGIRELWIMDVNARCIHVHRKPSGNRYAWPTVVTSRSVEIESLQEAFTLKELFG